VHRNLAHERTTTTDVVAVRGGGRGELRRFSRVMPDPSMGEGEPCWRVLCVVGALLQTASGVRPTISRSAATWAVYACPPAGVS
jgi:hypothetical protein